MTLETPFQYNEMRMVEQLSPEVVKLSALDLIALLPFLALKYGLERVENAVKNTYPKDSVEKIFLGMNVVMSVYV